MSDDTAATAELAEHFGRSARDAKWRHRLYDLLATARLCERDPRMTLGPDEFPYYTLDVPRPNGPAGTVTVPALVELATSHGFGIIIHAGQFEPWIFSCGDLVTLRAFGTYEFPRVGIAPGNGPIFRDVRKAAQSVSIGAPPATLLPGFVTPVLRRYFTHRLRIAQPGVLALLCAQQDPPEQLVFRLSRADFANEAEFEAALAGVTWFLPRHVVVSVLTAEIVADLDAAFVRF